MKWCGKRWSKCNSFSARNGAKLLAKRVAYWGIRAQPITTFSESEVRAATDNYRHRIEEWLLISDVSFFKGRLPCGPAVVVKVPHGMSEYNSEQVMHEITILSGISHRNVVKLLGCCLETDTPILVSELIPGGTLRQRLELARRGVRPLPWVDRVRIAGEVADALNYLHLYLAMPIVHRDVKAANIFLDEQGTAKIDGFHVSVRSHPDEEKPVVGGTLAYVEPEYLVTGILNEKCDVYSFGLLLLTLLVGKEPSTVPLEYEGYSDFVKWVTSYMQQDNLIAVLEPSILQEGRVEDIQLFAEVALRCVQRREDRPTMKDVVCDLWQINCTKH